ncbi:coiled-coil domain 6-like protein [Achlya hypogyna]|uniref:Coiled-coil domain 6-like protein n=1 Tax=Achlya hypogyna TaxID=1202772 RepID=A0A1V9ZIN0_ACHHY|nr:coiled-coil domain 6-like protein [Achlya hypogyna]
MPATLSTPAESELDALRRRNLFLEAELRRSREELVRFGSDAERSEERLTNKLLHRLGQLRLEKEQLALSVEREEEFLTNTLQRKLRQLQQDKIDLENKLETEQEFMVNRLQKQLEAALSANPGGQNAIIDKVKLENELEQEQEYVVNRLQKQVTSVKVEKRKMEQRLLEEMLQMITLLEAQVYSNVPAETALDSLERELQSMKDSIYVRMKKQQATPLTDDISETHSLNNEVLSEQLHPGLQRPPFSRRGTL